MNRVRLQEMAKSLYSLLVLVSVCSTQTAVQHNTPCLCFGCVLASLEFALVVAQGQQVAVEADGGPVQAAAPAGVTVAEPPPPPSETLPALAALLEDASMLTTAAKDPPNLGAPARTFCGARVAESPSGACQNITVPSSSSSSLSRSSLVRPLKPGPPGDTQPITLVCDVGGATNTLLQYTSDKRFEPKNFA